VAEIKLFGRWSLEGIQVKDPGLKRYIDLTPTILPRSRGRFSQRQFYKSKMNLVERLVNKLMVPGHRGKKHVRTSGRCVGRSLTIYRLVIETFDQIEKTMGKNPIQILVGAVENAALREEIAAYRLGGIIVRRAVVTSPQRRVDLALRALVQAAHAKSFGKKGGMAEALAAEIMGAWANDPAKSQAVKERERIEREAEGAR
jgi:small subunit ribosomal protein S7